MLMHIDSPWKTEMEPMSGVYLQMSTRNNPSIIRTLRGCNGYSFLPFSLGGLRHALESRTPSATRFVITPSPRLDAGRFDNRLVSSATGTSFSLSSKTGDIEEQSTFVVNVIDSFIAVDDELTGAIASDRVD